MVFQKILKIRDGASFSVKNIEYYVEKLLSSFEAKVLVLAKKIHGIFLVANTTRKFFYLNNFLYL